MKILSKLFIFSSLVLFVGCAATPQLNVNAPDDFWSGGQKIGVYVDDLPEVKGHIFGAGCLLCLATASAINGDLDKHMKTQSSETLNDVEPTLIEKLSSKNFEVIEIKDSINLAKLKKNSSKGVNVSKKDFRPFGAKYGVDYVLVVDINLVGTIRDFSGYVPQGDPYAVFRADMYIVDTSTNMYTLYEDINLTKYSETPWKEEGFPGITNAFYTVIELGKEKILDLTVETAEPK